MQTEIKKWGDSAVVQLPATMLSELALSASSPVELRHEDGRLVIEPVRPVRQGWFESTLAPEGGAFDSIPFDEGEDEWVW